MDTINLQVSTLADQEDTHAGRAKSKKPSLPGSFEFGLRFRVGVLAWPPWSRGGKAVVRSNGASQLLENRSSSAWFELAATHFIRSDLSTHAVQDASHLDSERKLSEGTQIPGKGYGLPAKGHSLKSNLCGPCHTKFHCFLVRSPEDDSVQYPFRAWCAYFSCPGWRPVGMAI